MSAGVLFAKLRQLWVCFLCSSLYRGQGLSVDIPVTVEENANYRAFLLTFSRIRRVNELNVPACLSACLCDKQLMCMRSCGIELILSHTLSEEEGKL